jgi:hypothetical protein
VRKKGNIVTLSDLPLLSTRPFTKFLDIDLIISYLSLNISIVLMSYIHLKTRATIISPVGQITYKAKDYVIADVNMGDLSRRLYDEIVAIQYGERPDPYGWVERIG